MFKPNPIFIIGKLQIKKRQHLCCRFFICSKIVICVDGDLQEDFEKLPEKGDNLAIKGSHLNFGGGICIITL